MCTHLLTHIHRQEQDVSGDKAMKTVTVRELRNQTSEILNGAENVLVTSHSHPTALIVPLKDPKNVPLEMRRQLYLTLSAQLAEQLQAKGITEDEAQRGFEDFKKRRRGR